MPFSKFIPSYHHHFGRQCRVADYGYTKLMELFEALPHVVQILGSGSRRYVTLSHRSQVKRFLADLLRVLKSQSSKQISVADFPLVYRTYAAALHACASDVTAFAAARAQVTEQQADQ